MKRIIAGSIKEVKNYKTNRYNYEVKIYNKPFGKFITEEEAVSCVKNNVAKMLVDDKESKKTVIDICVEGKFRKRIHNIYYIFRKNIDGYIEIFTSTEYDFNKYNPWIHSKVNFISLFNKRKYCFEDVLRASAVGSRVFNWWRMFFAAISISIVIALTVIFTNTLSSEEIIDKATNGFISSTFGSSVLLSIKTTLYVSAILIAIALIFDIAALVFAYKIHNNKSLNRINSLDWRKTFKAKINIIELSSASLKLVALILFAITTILWFRINDGKWIPAYGFKNYVSICYLILLVINVVIQFSSLTIILRRRKSYLTKMFNGVEINDFNQWYEDEYATFPYFKKSTTSSLYNVEIGYKYLKHTYNRVTFGLTPKEYKDKIQIIKKDAKTFNLVVKNEIFKKRGY